MRHLRDVHPEYADRVGVLAVSVDPSETADQVLSYKDTHGFPWPMTTADAEMIRSYNVIRQAGFVTLDSDGVVFSSVTYGTENADDWRKLFESLLGS